MKIHNDHLYHGAALTQIAEHQQFTAINAVRVGKQVHRSAFKINDGHCVFLKYATKPTPAHGEYVFTLSEAHLADLKSLSKKSDRLFLALVCVEDRQIALLPYLDLLALIDLRRIAKGSGEPQYTLIVLVEAGKKLRVNMNYPGRKQQYLRNHLMVSRDDFPNRLFES